MFSEERRVKATTDFPPTSLLMRRTGVDHIACACALGSQSIGIFNEELDLVINRQGLEWEVDGCRLVLNLRARQAGMVDADNKPCKCVPEVRGTILRLHVIKAYAFDRWISRHLNVRRCVRRGG